MTKIITTGNLRQRRLTTLGMKPSIAAVAQQERLARLQANDAPLALDTEPRETSGQDVVDHGGRVVETVGGMRRRGALRAREELVEDALFVGTLRSCAVRAEFGRSWFGALRLDFNDLSGGVGRLRLLLLLCTVVSIGR